MAGDVSGDQDVERFVELAQSLGLYVILRIGPYMDAEQDMGGLPAWLLKHPNIGLRKTDAVYQAAVNDFYKVALPKLRPHLYPNGGSIIMVQVENEYGSYYACDRAYTSWLLNLVRELFATDDIVYFTTDGGAESYLKCGVINGTYPTVDFGTSDPAGVASAFRAQRKYAPKGPLVNSEFYPGWFDMWGNKHSTVPIAPVLDTITYMYQMNASFNIYPFLGGTNWGYQAGAEAYPDGFGTITTSYDFDAPLTESGDLTPKWYAIRQRLQVLSGKRNKWPIPKNVEKVYYGVHKMEMVGNVFDLLEYFVDDYEIVHSDYPMTMEQLDFYYGMVLYETTVRKSGNQLDLRGVHDRGYVFVNRAQSGIIVQRPNINATTDVQLQAGDVLSILVENQGRICYGTFINDSKGIVQNVTLNGEVLRKWSMTPLDFHRVLRKVDKIGWDKTTIRQSHEQIGNDAGFVPTLYSSSFEAAPYAGDTYIDVSKWGRGFAFATDGYNLGRYWSTMGPQLSLYHPFVKPGKNKLSFFEMEHPAPAARGDAEARLYTLVNYPIYGEKKTIRTTGRQTT